MKVTVPDGSDVPVWALGLAGALPVFQGAVGTGFEMTSYHCRHTMGQGDWVPADILPASMSGASSELLPQHVPDRSGENGRGTGVLSETVSQFPPPPHPFSLSPLVINRANIKMSNKGRKGERKTLYI